MGRVDKDQRLKFDICHLLETSVNIPKIHKAINKEKTNKQDNKHMEIAARVGFNKLAADRNMWPGLNKDERLNSPLRAPASDDICEISMRGTYDTTVLKDQTRRHIYPMCKAFSNYKALWAQNLKLQSYHILNTPSQLATF